MDSPITLIIMCSEQRGEQSSWWESTMTGGCECPQIFIFAPCKVTVFCVNPNCRWKEHFLSLYFFAHNQNEALYVHSDTKSPPLADLNCFLSKHCHNSLWSFPSHHHPSTSCLILLLFPLCPPPRLSQFQWPTAASFQTLTQQPSSHHVLANTTIIHETNYSCFFTLLDWKY